MLCLIQRALGSQHDAWELWPAIDRGPVQIRLRFIAQEIVLECVGISDRMKDELSVVRLHVDGRLLDCVIELAYEDLLFS